MRFPMMRRGNKRIGMQCGWCICICQTTSRTATRIERTTFREALDVMGESKLARETLGEHVFEWFLRNKRAEWADFQSRVTPFELERYLGNW